MNIQTRLDIVTQAQEIDATVKSAAQTTTFWAESSPVVRAGLLRGLADALETERDALVSIADQETHLGKARLEGEVARTAFQLRGFANEVEKGVPYAVVDDPAIAGAPPQGRPHLTRVQQPLGVVVMFSASNFPFAFSVLGGDTASALAAGCPVVVKAHSGHVRLSRAVYELARGVLKKLSLPEGLIGFVANADREGGAYLVRHPDIAAVAFTGSLSGGLALQKITQERPRPIPFFGELGSTNPLVALPAALAADAANLAKTLAGSICAGTGQFCTSPGLIVVLDENSSDAFIEQLGQALKPTQTHAMLTDGIRRSFEEGVQRVAAAASAVFTSEADGQGPAPRLFQVQASQFLANPSLREEVFGPLAIIVRAKSVQEIIQVLDAIGGSLTVTIWGAESATDENRDIVRAARRIGGRVLFSGVPTGVAVTHAQQHGGPFPASTQPQTTSVGYAALHRFLRPLALQDAPAWVLANQGGHTL